MEPIEVGLDEGGASVDLLDVRDGSGGLVPFGHAGKATSAAGVWMAVWWMTEAIPIYATALLTEEINARRPPEMQVIIPQVDARLWASYHETHWPHHLTRTIMY